MTTRKHSFSFKDIESHDQVCLLNNQPISFPLKRLPSHCPQLPFFISLMFASIFYLIFYAFFFSVIFSSLEVF
ncbi:hypothetical protein A7K93_04990 [Candidatus Methylacidiphilum fumarolicum]|nr:hypothetical protein A7K73_06885 [Candidatus Methylacidiphilum fumarolicum]TFE74046.1 hypothetical protein A7K93_04990 [Candidatus Methylacidiphilum fumarolicum]TFE74156.1 hypothetical protein A7D33_02135 [Candidatus Methylacidiphilum fumarolicum]TFE74927.1 hypothetical protein A7K72_02805 [Candidatus Methylacidiphilum fumarolicum]